MNCFMLSFILEDRFSCDTVFSIFDIISITTSLYFRDFMATNTTDFPKRELKQTLSWQLKDLF